MQSALCIPNLYFQLEYYQILFQLSAWIVTSNQGSQQSNCHWSCLPCSHFYSKRIQSNSLKYWSTISEGNYEEMTWQREHSFNSFISTKYSLLSSHLHITLSSVWHKFDYLKIVLSPITSHKLLIKILDWNLFQFYQKHNFFSHLPSAGLPRLTTYWSKLKM